MAEQHVSPVQRAVDKFSEVSPGSVPSAGEDLTGYKSLRSQIVGEEVDKVAIQKLAHNIAQIHRSTHVAALPSADFQRLGETFSNGVAKQIAQQTFQEPFASSKLSNQQPQEVMPSLSQVCSDQSLLTTVETLQALFLEKKESLIHGNLNGASVLVKDGVAKMVDLESVHVGPCAYDLAMILSDFLILYHKHLLTPEDNDRHRRVAYKLLDVANNTVSSYLDGMTCYCGNSREAYVKELLSEVSGFTGCLLIKLVTSMHDREDFGFVGQSAGHVQEVMQSGIRLLRAYHRIHNIGMLLNIALMLSY